MTVWYQNLVGEPVVGERVKDCVSVPQGQGDRYNVYIGTRGMNGLKTLQNPLGEGDALVHGPVLWARPGTVACFGEELL